MNWSFAQPKSLAVITVASVVSGNRPVLYFSHDEDDGGWQFLDGTARLEANVLVVGLGGMVESDPALAELADLQEGFIATRSSTEDACVWQRRPNAPFGQNLSFATAN
ncbi:hypothetical protein [Paracidovorax konjaci]|uniref:hypothetical protein n=1 Tax=Paracidovorax konjaci TaxID=32040 RepID=UPI000B836986|nr:hypothetical protein [Paracidovorax konjaci]